MFELFLIAALIVLIVLAAIFYILASWIESLRPVHLHRLPENPILSPIAGHWWESEAVFNPAAFVYKDRVHLLYRALGRDGISRIGYASSADGVHFDERLAEPAYQPSRNILPDPRGIHTLTYRTLTYDTVNNGSGGGWGGSEDPRAVIMEDRVYMTFTAFEGWNSERMTLTFMPVENLSAKKWMWSKGIYISPPGQVQKNWVLFPEKINGHFAILHGITPNIRIHYFDSMEDFDGDTFIESSYHRQGREGFWDNQMRGAGAPPLKTKEGWLVFYHGFDAAHPDIAYKVGVMLLDLNDPTKVLYRSSHPILEAKEWYENDWKVGVTYASGTVIFHDDLIVYYGGGDKRIAAAKMPLKEFLNKLMRPQNKV